MAKCCLIEIAEQLIPYIKEMGYIMLSFAAIMEHPLICLGAIRLRALFTSRFVLLKNLCAC